MIGHRSNVPLIEVSDASVVRDGQTILHPLSLSVAVGEHVAILGANGSGKSTLIKLLTREIHAHAGKGTVKILGEERWHQRDLRTKLASVSGEPKEPLLGAPTVLDVAISGRFGTYGVLWGYPVTDELRRRGYDVLKELEIEHLADRDVTTLSAGEYRRTFIARALIDRPLGLVLDEPTSSLDLKSTRDFLATIGRLARDRNFTLILVTHHLEEIIPEIGRVILLKKGRVIADGPIDNTLTDESMSETFGACVHIVHRHPFRAVIHEPNRPHSTPPTDGNASQVLVPTAISHAPYTGD